MNSSNHYPNLRFDGLDSDYLRNCFLTALAFYPELKNCPIVLQMKQLHSSTMNARPLFNRKYFFTSKREFTIGICPIIQIDKITRIEDVPEKVLIGWFVHELGHIMDYQHRSWWDLARFGILYVLSHDFHIKAERKADLFAIAHSCGDYILATKNFILDHADLSETYKARIRRYYMSPDEVLLLVSPKVEEAMPMDGANFFE